jgi:membrane protease YdiL (CAAX protease family)
MYWGVCGALTLALLTREEIAGLLADRRPRLGPHATLGAALICWPPIGTIVTRFLPEVGDSSAAVIATTAGIALTNAAFEELLWRGVFITLWPDSRWLGWLWPAIGFGVWHFAPQVIHPAAMGPVAYVAAATALGLSWGWVAYRTGSIRWVGVSHIVTDGSGLRNALFFIVR